MPLLTDFIPQASIIPLNGNLGLGVSIPNERLTVAGNISASGLVFATSTRAGNLTGGSAGQIPYQVAPNITLFAAAGTSGQVLQSTGTSAPTWLSQSSVVAGSAIVLSNTRTLWGQSFNGEANVSGNINVGGNVTNIGNIVLGNSADPNKATIQYNGTLARTYTITDAGANADFVMTQGTQSISGDKTFNNIVNATTTQAGHLTGGSGGQIVYQRASNITAFTAAGTNGQLLQSNGTNAAPSWVNSTSLNTNTAATLANSRTLWGQSFNGGANVSGNLSDVGTITLGTLTGKATLTYTTNIVRTYTIPDAGANADFVMTAGTQTIGGSKTFSSSLTLNGDSTSLIIGGTNKATLSLATLAAARTYTIPDAGASADFMMTAGNQTITGTKTFSSTIAGSVNGTAAGIASGVQYNIPIQSGAGTTTFITNGTTNQILTYTASGPAWQTPTLGIPTITTTNTTLVNGQVLGVNTTSSIVSATLPASPLTGNRVEIFDSHRKWNTFNCVIVRNGQNIDNLPENLVCDVVGSYIILIYIDSTRGWSFYNTQS